MQQKLQLQINQPCRENWNRMTPHQQGRFCSACQKMVVDFTVMGNEQLLDYFKNYDGNTCGRFENGQLDRPIFVNPQTKTSWQKWTFAVLLAGLLLLNKAKAQGEVVLTEQLSNKKLEDTQTEKVQQINGQVLDERGNGIPYASVLVKNENWGTATDSFGNFRLITKTGLKFADLTISSVGYVSKEINVGFDQAEKHQKIVVLKTQYLQDGVVITGYGITKGRIDIMGSVTKVSKEIKSQSHSIKQEDIPAMPVNTFKIYPNPAKAASTITLQLNEPNNYLLRLINMNGQVYQ